MSKSFTLSWCGGNACRWSASSIQSAIKIIAVIIGLVKLSLFTFTFTAIEGISVPVRKGGVLKSVVLTCKKALNRQQHEPSFYCNILYSKYTYWLIRWSARVALMRMFRYMNLVIHCDNSIFVFTDIINPSIVINQQLFLTQMCCARNFSIVFRVNKAPSNIVILGVTKIID